MHDTMYDIVIVGGGPAGLTAALYSSRAGLKTLVLERIMPGGYVATISYIENYPGFPQGIRGFDLAEKMKEQAQRFGAEIKGTEVIGVRKQENIITVETTSSLYQARAVIIATGTRHKRLDVPGEVELTGRGVSYCATCDGPLFKERSIAVIGCGNSGLQEGHFLLTFAKDILFVETMSCILAEPILQKPLKGDPRVRFLLNHEVISINGKDRVESITVKNRTESTEQTYPIAGVFIYAGLTPMSEAFCSIMECDQHGFIRVDDALCTSVSGIFAAGDIRSKKVRQIVTACGDGAEAAMQAYHYIESLK